MTTSWPKIHSFHSPRDLRSYAASIGFPLPLVDTLSLPGHSPLRQSIGASSLVIPNRFAIQPMEGWDGTPGGRPTPRVLRRWRRFGESGAGLIWGGEAYAVCVDGRANPNQLYLQEHSPEDLVQLRESLLAGARDTGVQPVIGLQLTHSGRFCRPYDRSRMAPQIAYAHPLLNPRFGLPMDYPVLSDGSIRSIVERFHAAARAARDAGFDFVDVKHCHGYLGHELLTAHERPGDYGGSFEGRTRFLREVVQGIRTQSPGLAIGVRLSAFDFLPYRPDPATSAPGRPGRGVPEPWPSNKPYLYAFGADSSRPADTIDLVEPARFLELLSQLNINMVNLTAGSPYYNPHIQRPATFPPSDGYLPPEDPLAGVGRQIAAAAILKARFPNMLMVGTAYTYLQEYLPYVAEAAVAEGLIDMVGLGRMTLSYPGLARDILEHGAIQQPKSLCRTFSDCTTAPRNGLVSGCYPLDDEYRHSSEHLQLKEIKQAARQ